MKDYILRYMKRPKLYLRDRKMGVIIARSANARDCSFEGKNKIYANVCVSGSSIGLGTYVSSNSRIHNSRIGRYCSIGPETVVLAGRHPISERLSSHPCFYSSNQQAGFTYVEKTNFNEYVYADSEKSVFVDIGSDVWIGARVTLLGGIKIGHGAVIASGSVVTKDVEPYSVVAGVPSKIIRYRFDEATRLNYLEEKWWEKGEDWIHSNIQRFYNDIN
ncbi:CatB-related O-acetyltransferase [Verrucomicrobiaceae bacterium 5K15]|uniref:CatB-related O-acetyltransferase n=1 Tax=Oceaniferula flava TaxID=2800421 RepID=A0AAE2SGN7_9BACT|nr:CatB-related O-acetyltransferase [Oceaniferula flavus]MBK1856539.1 CatB-related O-acetyltransferase [Oceaniferula flavus]MBM1137846.1 CatB-related O-acetyltransferase [Oceaniferula flavus]